MPYLTDAKKARLAPIVELMIKLGIKDVGEINYLACETALVYLDQQGINYAVLSGAIDALGDAHNEMIDRVLGHYENYKIVANGDIFDDIRRRIDIVMKEDA